METINGLHKADSIRTTVFHDGFYKTLADVEYATAGWVDWYTKGASTAHCGCSPPASTSWPISLLALTQRSRHWRDDPIRGHGGACLAHVVPRNGQWAPLRD
jgi:hypothetical protein